MRECPALLDSLGDPAAGFASGARGDRRRAPTGGRDRGIVTPPRHADPRLCRSGRLARAPPRPRPPGAGSMPGRPSSWPPVPSGLQTIDGPYLGIRDDDGLRARAERVRALGFDGKWAVHPGQIDTINAVFTPETEEFERGERGDRRARPRPQARRSPRRGGARRRDDRRGQPEARGFRSWRRGRAAWAPRRERASPASAGRSSRTSSRPGLRRRPGRDADRRAGHPAPGACPVTGSACRSTTSCPGG